MSSRFLVALFGSLLVGGGIVGLLIPVVPGVILLLLGFYLLFGRHSPRLVSRRKHFFDTLVARYPRQAARLRRIENLFT